MNKLASYVTLSAASLAAIGLFCGTADAATPTTTPTTAAHLGSYDKGAFSVQETITNNTGQTLTFDPAHSSVDNGSGHWGTPPLTTLKDGQRLSPATPTTSSAWDWT